MADRTIVRSEHRITASDGADGKAEFRAAVGTLAASRPNVPTIDVRNAVAMDMIAPVVRPGSNRMAISMEELWSMSEQGLIGAHHEARRQFVDKKFARDTQRARLEWMRAKQFVGLSGGVTERRMAVDVSEELAR